MYTFTLILIMLAAVLLIFIVTIQNSKGGGLAAGFSSSNQIMGVRKTTDFLEKATWGLAGFIIVASIAITAVLPDKERRTGESEIRQQVDDATILDNSTIAPNFGTAQQPLVSEEEMNGGDE